MRIHLYIVNDKNVHALNFEKIKNQPSSVYKWIGIIEDADLGDWKADRRNELERKHGEGFR